MNLCVTGLALSGDIGTINNLLLIHLFYSKCHNCLSFCKSIITVLLKSIIII